LGPHTPGKHGCRPHGESKTGESNESSGHHNPALRGGRPSGMSLRTEKGGGSSPKLVGERKKKTMLTGRVFSKTAFKDGSKT